MELIENRRCKFKLRYGELLSKDEADDLLQFLDDNLVYNTDKESSIIIKGKKTKIPRKQASYGDNGAGYRFSGIKVNARPWDKDLVGMRLKDIVDDINEKFDKKYNFVLINKYRDGNDYIGHHSDSKTGLIPDSSIAGISLGGMRTIIFRPKSSHASLVDIYDMKNPHQSLDHGSIFIMEHPTNDYWTHSIPKLNTPVPPRISLTLREMDL